MKRIPTYLIHGSLGSGKTTFLNHLLKSDQFKGSVVIENEYANVNIDNRLLADCHVKIFDVSGGCICCTSGKEFFESLDAVSREKSITSLFIETTGVASSVSLIKQLMLSSSFDDKFQLVKNIFIVDVLEDTVHSLKNEKLLDILMADIIIMTKCDLVSTTKVKAFARLFKELDVLFSTAQKGKVSLHYFDSHTPSKSIDVLRKHISEIQYESFSHSNEILYQVIYPSKTISIHHVQKLFDNLSDSIYRVKGIFTNESGKKISINATSHNYEFAELDTNDKDAIVVIGKNLTKGRIKTLEDILC